MSLLATAPEGRPRAISAPGGPVPSFEQLFFEHAPFVWRALRRLGVHEADAEDVCQEVFMIVHRRLASFEGRSSVQTWLGRRSLGAAGRGSEAELHDRRRKNR
ncbi:RNA polymerase sigma factor [Sorangium sp. So ce363]|uniref:RNA polymerase sigma factor n=1 Tax=Sorangium sp. So ce363 TaxID=3133304 RepID=UPI003F6220A3